MKLDKRIKKIMTMFHYHGSLVTGMNNEYVCIKILYKNYDDMFCLLPLESKDSYYYWDMDDRGIHMYLLDADGFWRSVNDDIGSNNFYKDIYNSIVNQ